MAVTEQVPAPLPYNIVLLGDEMVQEATPEVTVYVTAPVPEPPDCEVVDVDNVAEPVYVNELGDTVNVSDSGSPDTETVIALDVAAW